MPQVTTLIARSSAQSAALELPLDQLPQKPLPAQAMAQGLQATAQGTVPVYRVQPGADVVLRAKDKVDAKLKFKKHGTHLLLEQDGQALVLLEDVFDAQGLPQASVGLRSAQAALQPWQDEAGLVDLSAQHGVGEHKVVATLQEAQPLGSIDGSANGTAGISHTGLSLGEQAALPSLFSATNLVVTAASVAAAAGGGAGGSSTAATPTPAPGLNITGNNQNNRLVGSASANTIDGAGGDDILMGGGGDDTLIGGTGQDTAVYKGHAADYAISYDSATDTWQVRDLYATDGDEGTDTLSGIERLQFSNGSLGLVSPVRDAQGKVLIAARLVGTTAADVLPTGSGYVAVGGGGDDIYIVRTGQAAILEQDGQGNDTVVSYVAATLPDFVENVTVAETGDVASTLLAGLTVSGPPVVALAELPNTSNSAYAAGFAVSAGSTITVTVNGTALTAAQLAARFATRTDSASGQTLYTANNAAFDGTETVVVNASLADSTGQVGTATPITLRPIDTTPAAVPLAAVTDPDNAAFDSGFVVNAGAAVAVTVNGTSLSASQLAERFATSTTGTGSTAQTTYTAKANAFVGTETVVVGASQTDSAGNVGTASRTLQPIDTTAPALSLYEVADPDNAAFALGFVVSQGARLSLTFNGQLQTDAQTAALLAARFNTTTANGLVRYEAKTGAFAGSETVQVNASQTDSAGNTGNATALSLKPIDTTAPALALSELTSTSNTRFADGFVVTAGASVNLTLNGVLQTPAQLAARFASTTTNGQTTYTAQPSAFDGSETVLIGASLTDAAGNRSTASRTLQPIDTTPPGVPTLIELLDADNGAFADGFAVSTGATVGVSVNGTALTAAQLAERFAASNDSTSGQTRYTAKANAFVGNEVVKVSASQTDGAGNSVSATPLTLKPIDTSAPALSLAEVADADNAAFADGFVVTQGATLSGTFNGTAQTEAQILSRFVATTANGQTRYTAKPGHFAGTEAVTINASLTDAAGNSSSASLNLKPIDTTGPSLGLGTVYDPHNSAFADGFVVASDASVVVKVNGTTLSATELAARFATSTSGTGPSAQTRYTAKTGAFTGSEAVTVSASQTDSAGNPSTASITLPPIDTTAPVLGLSAVANAGDSSYDDGFVLAQGASLTVTVNGSPLSAAQLATRFATTTSTSGTSSNAQTRYTAKPGTFDGSETVQVSASQTDSAGNASSASITLQRIDTTPPGAPSLIELADAHNSSYADGFAVSAGAVVSVSVNGTALTATELAARFATSADTANGQTRYTAKPGAFAGTEVVVVSASLADSAGNSVSAASLTLRPIDSTAPAVALSAMADADNAAFDAGFVVSAGSAVSVSVNGTVLSSYEQNNRFASTTVGGQTTYTARPGAFDGTEALVVNASLADSAGNTGNATALTLKPIDTTAPWAFTPLADADNSSYASGFTVLPGATLSVSIGGTVQTPAQLATRFDSSTDANGQTTYTAKAGAFTGSEAVAVTASLSSLKDSAGNVAGSTPLTLKPIDTTPPVVTLAEIVDADTVTTGAYQEFRVDSGNIRNVSISKLSSGGFLVTWCEYTYENNGADQFDQ